MLEIPNPTEPNDLQTDRPTWVFIWLLTSQALTLLSYLPWLLLMSWMYLVYINEDPSIVYTGCCVSILPWLSLILAWVFYHRQRYTLAVICTTLPLFFAVPVLGVTVWVIFDTL